MSKIKYLLHSLTENLSNNDNFINHAIFEQMKATFKLKRLKQYYAELFDDDKILKFTGKKLYDKIKAEKLNPDDYPEILKYEMTNTANNRVTTNKKILKTFNKTEITDEEQEKLLTHYDEINPYKEQSKYLEDKGKNDGIELQPHQRRFIEGFFYANLRGAIAFWGVGTGKTLGAVSSMKLYLGLFPSNKIIIISPPALIGNMANSMVDYGINIQDKRILFYTYDEYYRHGIDAENCFVIIDEAHNFRTEIETRKIAKEGERDTDIEAISNKKGYAVLTKAGFKCHKILLLTGTPFVNGLYDIENLISFAEGKEPTTRDNFGYICSDNDARYDYFKYRISHYMDTGDNGNFPKINYNYIPIIVHNEEILADLQQKPTLDTNPFYSHSRSSSETYGAFKVNYVIEKIKENPTYKTIIYSTFMDAGIKQMEKKLKDNNIDFVRITGSETTSEKQQSVFRFSPEKAPKELQQNLTPVRVLLISRAGAEGVDTSNVRQLFVISGQWNEALYEQIIARASRYKSHHSLPPDQRFVNVYKLFLCSAQEAKEINKFNNPNYDFGAMLKIINDAKEREREKEKKEKAGKPTFDIRVLADAKKGSKTKKEILEAADYANKRDTYQRDNVVQGLFKGVVTADFMLFLLQKSKLQIITNFIVELDKIPQLEKSISDLPHAKEIFDEITTKNIQNNKIVPYLKNIINPISIKLKGLLVSVEKKDQKHIEQIQNALSKMTAPDIKKAAKKLLARNQEFFTSTKDARELVELSGIKNNYSSIIRVLEPSAGHGVLIRELLNKEKKNFSIDMVEIMNDNREVLKTFVDAAPSILNLMHEQNFLLFTSSTVYDLVIMNPPFHIRKSDHPMYKRDIYDIDFVMRAYAMLSDGGVLVAIVSQHWKSDKKYEDWLESVNWMHNERTQYWSGLQGREAQEITALPITVLKITRHYNKNIGETGEILNLNRTYIKEENFNK